MKPFGEPAQRFMKFELFVIENRVEKCVKVVF